jgi:STE24 endopeptidase
VVLFDTLLDSLTAAELTAVLAHEIGHSRLRHVWQGFLGSALGSGGAFYLVSRLAEATWFAPAFGFAAAGLTPTLLLSGLLGGTVSFWLLPFLRKCSRRHEYQADAFAARLLGDAGPLVSALRKLSTHNLSNQMPHPLFSAFYGSHPTWVERAAALARLG